MARSLDWVAPPEGTGGRCGEPRLQEFPELIDLVLDESME